MILILLGLVAGFAALYFGAELLLKGAVAVARKLGVSNLFIGLVLVGFGTSTPELAASLKGALAGSPGIALGNVIGSNLANSLLILGVTALICPVVADPKAFKRDAPVLVIATAALVAMVSLSGFVRVAGAGLLGFLAVYCVWTYRIEKRTGDAAAKLHEQEVALEEPGALGQGKALGFVVIGIALTLLGANWLVGAAMDLARMLSIPDKILGLTLVALGTSLPELATSVTAARKGHTDLALGNVIGSNLFNVLGILGAVTLTRPFEASWKVYQGDIFTLIAATTLLVVFALTEWKVTRREGMVFVAIYGFYLATLVASA